MIECEAHGQSESCAKCLNELTVEKMKHMSEVLSHIGKLAGVKDGDVQGLLYWAEMNSKVYEITDTSNEEMYFPLVVVATLEEAQKYLDNNIETESMTEYGSDGNEHEEITVHERTFGVTGRGVEVLQLSRETFTKEDSDDVFWRTVEDKSECDHNFVSADNEVITGAEVCTKCHTIKAS